MTRISKPVKPAQPRSSYQSDDPQTSTRQSTANDEVPWPIADRSSISRSEHSSHRSTRGSAGEPGGYSGPERKHGALSASRYRPTLRTSKHSVPRELRRDRQLHSR